MIAVELVAVREDECGRQVIDATRQEADRVERRLIGPVHVLDDEHRRGRARQLLAQGIEDLLAVARAAPALQSAQEVAHGTSEMRASRL